MVVQTSQKPSFKNKKEIIEKLCVDFASKEGNVEGYDVLQKEKSIVVSCKLCKQLLSLGPFSKKINNLELHAKASKSHRLNLALQIGSSAAEQHMEARLEMKYPGVFTVTKGVARCNPCNESYIITQKNFERNMKQHVEGKGHMKKCEV